jgi:tetratricopeptide (TPR) repeat protein
MDMDAEGFIIEEGLDQRYEVLKELGDCHTSLGNHDRARQCFEEAAVIAPDKPAPHVGCGVVALQTRCLPAAEKAFRQALHLEPACAEAWAGLAMVAQTRQEFERAFDLYLKALDADSDNLVALLGLFQSACQMGTFSKVTHYLELYLARHPGDTSVLFCLATLYARDGRLDEAEETLLAVLALDPSLAEAQKLLDEVRVKRSRTPEAARP